MFKFCFAFNCNALDLFFRCSVVGLLLFSVLFYSKYLNILGRSVRMGSRTCVHVHSVTHMCTARKHVIAFIIIFTFSTASSLIKTILKSLNTYIFCRVMNHAINNNVIQIESFNRIKNSQTEKALNQTSCAISLPFRQQIFKFSHANERAKKSDRCV